MNVSDYIDRYRISSTRVNHLFDDIMHVDLERSNFTEPMRLDLMHDWSVVKALDWLCITRRSWEPLNDATSLIFGQPEAYAEFQNIYVRRGATPSIYLHEMAHVVLGHTRYAPYVHRKLPRGMMFRAIGEVQAEMVAIIVTHTLYEMERRSVAYVQEWGYYIAGSFPRSHYARQVEAAARMILEAGA